MGPVLIVLIAYWAFSGAATSLKAVFAGDGPAAPEATTSTASAGPDPTFGQRRREAYRRWRKALRRGMPGTDGGRGTGDIFGDAGATTLAGAALFATGFVSGATWLAGKIVERRAAERLHDRRRPRTSANARPRNEPRPSIPLAPPQHDDGPGPEGTVEAEIIDGPQPRTGTAANDDIEDAEILYDPAEDDGAGPDPAASPDPALAPSPESGTAPPGDPMTEILTIHHLFSWGNDTAATAANALEQAVIRRNSAMQRAESAAAAAANADGRAVELEAAIARFGALNMDPASLAAMHAAHEAAVMFAATERRRAEAEAATATAAQASAAAADVHRNAVLAMNATVQAHQSPHAEAQAVTGNAAAHASVLEAS